MQNFSKAAELKAKAEQLRAKVGISSEDGEEIKITNTSNVDDGIDKDLMELERLDQFEELLDMAFADGVLTDQEKEVIMKKSRGLGIDADETEMILEAKTYELGATRNKNSNESCDSEISAPNYQKEFDKITV